MLLYHTIACIPPISKIILKIVLFQEKNHNNNDDDLVSLYIFGEDESVLAAEADINNGVVSYHKVAKHHYKDIPLSNGHQYHQVRSIGCDSFVFVSLCFLFNDLSSVSLYSDSFKCLLVTCCTLA